MRLAILNITAGGLSGGYRKYLDNTIPYFIGHKDVTALLIASPEGMVPRHWRQKYPSVKWVDLKPNIWSFSGIGKNERKVIMGFNPGVIFIPTSRYWEAGGVPTVNMVRNMEPLLRINEGIPLLERIRNWFRVYYSKRAVKQAKRVIAVSKFVKEFLVKKWNIKEEKVGIVYHGIGWPQVNPARPFIIPAGWDRKFFFTAGSIRPARGLEDILRAMDHLSKEGHVLAGLVIAGNASTNMGIYQEKLKRWAEKQGLSNRICWAGYLNEQEMSWCYQNCFSFIMSSKVEACPNIALEAMSHGCLCLSNTNAPMPEFFKEAAVYYPSENHQALAQLIKSVLRWNSSQKERMAGLAKDRAGEFSWGFCVGKTVEELITVYRS